MINKKNLMDEQMEDLRQKAINNAINKFNWTRERCEEVLGSNTREFLQRVNLINTEEQE